MVKRAQAKPKDLKKMTYVKKLVMEGFKSFAGRTEIPFDRTLNVVLGPNGAGKSNITDALCFVLGRLSIKSMRASKASNLIHNGGKEGSPSEEARVEMVFDNTSKVFSVESPEVSISRTVRKNGNSIYKIQGETRTRQEVLELLAQAGIDPNGFNIILQEEISRFVEMHPEDRRKIIEQVAGISIYEDKKHKSLLELERTDEKMKEVRTILNERNTYLRNLDRERKEALSYEHLKKTIERDKAALLFRLLEERKKSQEGNLLDISEKEERIVKSRKIIDDLEVNKSAFAQEIEEINRQIEKATGVEQEKLFREISQVKVDEASLSVRLENFSQQVREKIERKANLEIQIEKNLADLKHFKESLPKGDVKKMMGTKTEAFASLEDKKAKLDRLKTEIVRIKSTIQSKQENKGYLVSRINGLHLKIEDLEKHISKEDQGLNLDGVLKGTKSSIKEIEELEGKKSSSSDTIAAAKREIAIIEKIKKDIKELDSCPLCMRKVTADHVEKVHKKSDADLENLRKKLGENHILHDSAEKRIAELKQKLADLQKAENRLRAMLITQQSLNEKLNERKAFELEVSNLAADIAELEKKRRNTDLEITKFSDIEKTYSNLREELKDMNKMRDDNEKIILEINLKEKDIESMKQIIKEGQKDRVELERNITEIDSQLKEKRHFLKENEQKEKEIREGFDKMFQKRKSNQDKLGELDKRMMDHKFKLRSLEDELNMMKIDRARIDAEVETSSNEFEQYKHLDIESLKLKQSRAEIGERIKRNEESIIRAGTVNLKALEVYDKVKEQCDEITIKVDTLEREKNEILSIINSIDKRKKNSFMKVFDDLNKGFAKNMFALGGKDAFLSLENKANPFEEGINIDVRLGKGKYLDVSSLSGGERTLAALSLIFAIQELKPYYFYIFDEIDAALDKRNSERLGSLLKNYIRNAQYIVITHNDSLISESPVLFGVSMQEGRSKVLSLKV